MSLDIELQGSQNVRTYDCTICGDAHRHVESFWSGNITHNLVPMAEAAGLYEVMWRPEEYGYTHAREAVDKLRAGLALLCANPEKFRRLNPANGWGSYEKLVDFVKAYLAACEGNLDATIWVSR